MVPAVRPGPRCCHERHYEVEEKEQRPAVCRRAVIFAQPAHQPECGPCHKHAHTRHCERPVSREKASCVFQEAAREPGQVMHGEHVVEVAAMRPKIKP